MTTQIANINARPVVHSNRELTIEGVCRTICANPFPHFTIEDRTGTLIVQSMNGLPKVGTHLEVTGECVINIPAKCTFAVLRLNETRRTEIPHHSNCQFVGCQFESAKAAFAA